MEKQELIKILVLIESVYPDFTVKNETVEDWFAVCRDMDYSQVLKNLACHMRRSPYPPLMAEIAAYSIEERQEDEEMMILDEEGWVHAKHDSLLPKQHGQPNWQNEYFVGF
ncbi:replicative helicase loader/inhibitor [Bacillus sp. B-jedd]|uniref:replicative helicase loader/inhibitor n=1 Tax=Bacillus sp. B-jedd TaxID=1476857 RepID=UPI00051571C4|nr:replicative helicase loader/inhibitor [Bacillus sp. B-jedd]CEG27274.1 hypothetical protein BN1002_02131 [Bacillus sp. B-jedd]